VIVAGIQYDLGWESTELSFSRASELIGQAVALGARFVVLPEQYATGFSMHRGVTTGAAAAALEFMAAQAREHGIWVCGGHTELAQPLPFNSVSLLDPAGEVVARYRKIHPFSLAGEGEHYQAGGEVVTVTVDGLRVTPLICYDLRFPEVFRLAAEGTDLYVVVANWPEARAFVWRALLQARAAENQAWVLGVNRVGDADGHHYDGSSAVVDPLGRTVCTLREQAGVVHAQVDADQVRHWRTKLGFLGDRRASLYERLAKDRA